MSDKETFFDNIFKNRKRTCAIVKKIEKIEKPKSLVGKMADKFRKTSFMPVHIRKSL